MTEFHDALFKPHGKHFQEGILHGLLTDHTWASQMSEVFKPDFFDLKYLAYLADKYFKYHEKYKCFPTLQLLISIIKDDLKQPANVVLKEQVVEFLSRIRTSSAVGDLTYIKEKSLDFCRKQAMREALEVSVELIAKDKYEEVVDMMKKAVSVGMTSSVGHDFFEDAEARFVKIMRFACPTGIQQLDDRSVLNGGLGKGELGVIVANTGVGKCTTADTLITIKYMEITINGKAYKPWDLVETKRGKIYARDITENDDIFQITYKDKVEFLSIQELFDQLNIDTDQPEERVCQWPIEILSFDAFYPVEGLRTVEPEKTITVKTKCGKSIEGAYDHIVMTHRGWHHLKDVVVGDKLVSHNESPIVSTIEYGDEKKKLYDFQVAIAHSFMTNGILSHNSHFLVQLGAEALRHGKNVVHYTFELTETAVGIRYDSNLTGIESSQIQDSKEEVLKKYDTDDLGRLIIKEYPTGSCTVGTIRNHLDKLALRGFVPHMIVIDYADIMRSSREFDALRMELKLIYEELRNLAMERSIPIWTASQANRDASSSDIVGLENMSESYGKAMVADVVLSLSRKPTEKATGAGRLFVAKNRAGKDGILFPVHIDTARSIIKVLDDDSLTLQETLDQDNSERKKIMREKWQQIMGGK